ncbi:major facilitator superfamily alpha-ketoglutarate/sugar transporter [Tanticharoenia sakaeratensis NBRC 103193]|nr:major facilitator superfamily alpha-ketoglutarate/sugar transporter [Tanticharoenia sakaeratensis NBRC 103193]
MEITPADLRRAAWTCSLGSALEYYDFALYSLASALVFGPLFFPSKSPGLALIASFATYSIGFAVRPVGGIFFGALGDKYGRKRVLLLTVTLMGIASTAIGLLPTYQQVGIWAPLALIGMRVLQGLGAGAEQAGAAVMMTEYAPPGKRGFYAAMPFLGIQIGTIIAALVYCALLFGGRDVVVSWVWRVPFLLSAIILAVALYMRLTLKESPAFAVMEEERAHEERPGLFGLLRQSWKTIIIGIGLRAGENGGSSLYQVLAISYIVHTMGLPAFSGTIALISAALVGGITVPVAGRMSDRFGRVKTYRAFAILELVSALPVWWAFSQGNTTLAAIGLSVGLGISAWGMFGSQAAFLPEMFGARHRYIGVSLTREVSAVVAGGITPLVGSFIIAMVIREWPSHAGSHPGSLAWIPLAFYVMALALTTIIATFFIPECRNRDLLDTRDLIQ